MPKILIIPGDGIGSEITIAARKVLEQVDKKFSLGLTYERKDAGGFAFEKYGTPLPDETVDAAIAADGVLFGAVGGPKWDYLKPELRPERALFGLRKTLGLYANLRPVHVEASLAEYSALKPEKVIGADFVIVRELTGGIYFGDRAEARVLNGVESAYDVEEYSAPEIERIARVAFETAKIRRGKVTSVDKANVLASSRLWRKTVERVAQRYPEVQLNHFYVDNCAMQIAANPKQFDVILTNNIFGDILSDEAAVVGGSIGMMPSASIGEKTSFFEPIHGSAPDIEGKGIANPVGTILSAAMLLRYALHEEKAAKAIEHAVSKALDEGWRTPDLWREGFKKAMTEDMTNAIVKNL